MTRIDPELLDILGLPDDARPQLLHHDAPPQRDQAHARGVDAPLTIAPGELYTPIALDLPGVQISRLDRDPTVMVVDTAADVQVRAGQASELQGGVLALHTRGHRAVLVIQTVALELNDGHLSAYRLPDPPPARMERLNQARGTAPAPLASPDIDALLGDEPAPPWLTDMARAMASRDTALDRAGAAGLLVRLWHPTDSARRRALLDQMRQGQLPAPIANARAWIASQPPAAIQQVAVDGQNEASALVESLPDLTHQVAWDRPAAAAIAKDLVWRRDRLESVCRLLDGAEHTQPLRPDLDDLDRACTVHMASITDVLDPSRDLDPDWLGAVAWQEPQRWWGAL